MLLPTLAMIGAHHAGREVVRSPRSRVARAEPASVTPPTGARYQDIILFYFPLGYAAAIVLVFAARGVRTLPSAGAE